VDACQDPGVEISAATAQELVRLSGLALAAPDLETALREVTEAAVSAVEPCDGASLTMRSNGVPSAPVASDDWATQLDKLQFVEQEGPCLDCLREASVMRSRDLAADTRFPSYGPKAAELGARSSLSLPLTADGRCVGALNLYSKSPDAFDREVVAVGELLAAHASLAVSAATAYYSSRDLAEQMRQALDSRAVIDQAKGVLMAQHGGSADEAFARLVETSQLSNRKLRDVAQELVELAEKHAL
jgi:GAF domain-containing protein